MTEISLRQVRKSYGKIETIHGVEFDIHDGEFIVMLGPSGCGKSTLLRMIAGLEEITSGEISIGGHVVNKLEPNERGCAMVFQNYALYPHMSVAENIGYSLKIAGVPKAERQQRIDKIAATLGLKDYLTRRPAELSGGQRQRVAMGRAMIREPKVFLFDEPLSNLDARLRVQMRAELRRMHQRLRTTSIFVTHDQIEAMTLADRLVVLNQGHVEQIGTPAEVYNKPATRFVASFIGSPPMSLIDGKIDGGNIFVQRDGGARLALTPNRADMAGRPVTLGVRPEAASLATNGAAGTVAARVDFVEELGAGRIVQADLNGTPFAIALNDERRINSGDTVHIDVPPDAIHLYDLATGSRL
ncbi:sn-glycerol-3-phosphate import ATP-binding protein UgpC [Methylovirgula sp. 4M-Z18]|uniref:sn-glycerol-3-phosphate import ATP-binding protein UgpC n=1 Tax=Methylovirgula sp. 4M-Z18 TaxID=2293567 RepID=UPI000E2FE259|nr:sn-glycerol-3-phosphate import ATP-binding protein UgpC [Methylovirgula sp. 4M-Z18]RFB79205.1 sn-glycerol-3-phosphate import ATP-binding protein UgpC [Methylovirgula sp. 4M-Z18]